MNDSIVRSAPGYRWDGVELRAYKPAGQRHHGITRQVLLEESEASVTFATRYFEIEPGGHSTLEKHEHPHVVVILRGQGRVVLGEELHTVQVPDAIHIGPWQLHQFHNDTREAFGFLCIVDQERDRPQFPSQEELSYLRSKPALTGWLKC